MATGPVRAAYGYEYMDVPNVSNTDIRNHILILSDAGINTMMIKILADTANPLTVRRWKSHLATAASRGMTVGPVYNYHNDYYRRNFSTPLRRYQVTASSASFLTDPDTQERTIACPLDPLYIRAMLTNGFQRLPQTSQVFWDPEFPGGPGGFHSYVNPCHCDGCKVDWYRDTYCEDEHCFILPADVPLPVDATLLAFEQAKHQELVARYAKQASYTDIGVLDNDPTDAFVASSVAGLVAAGKNVTVFSELTYDTGAAPTQDFGSVPVVGGFWLAKHTPAQLQSRAIAMAGPGYWLFTTFSFWLGQAGVDAQPLLPYGLQGTPGSNIAEYLAAITAANA